jgi:hypothetical protein
MATDPELPDAADAAEAEDLVPDDPPGAAPRLGHGDHKPAVKAPVPAHGEMASADQLAEGERAVDLANDAESDAETAG